MLTLMFTEDIAYILAIPLCSIGSSTQLFAEQPLTRMYRKRMCNTGIHHIPKLVWITNLALGSKHWCMYNPGSEAE